jgi:hypothetical protein
MIIVKKQESYSRFKNMDGLYNQRSQSGTIWIFQFLTYSPVGGVPNSALVTSRWLFVPIHTVKKKFLIYYEFQKGSGAKSYVTNGLPICEKIFVHFPIF